MNLFLPIVLMMLIVPVWGQTGSDSVVVPQTQVLGGGDTATNDMSDDFGRSIAISGDGRVMVVGAPLADNAEGIAYLYVREENSDWESMPTTILKASDGTQGDRFGVAIAIDGSGDTIVIGASEVNHHGLTLGGSVYIFTRADDGWVEFILDTAHPRPKAVYNFGTKVAITADGQTIAVGAGEGNYSVIAGALTGITSSTELGTGNGNTGLVEIFNRAGDRWVHEVFIGATNPDNGDEFADHYPQFWNTGRQESDLDMVGNRATAVLAVGAVGESDNIRGVRRNYRNNSQDARDSGAVYVYMRRDGEWDKNNIFYIKADNTGASDYFGHTVALSADGKVLAVGADGEDSDRTGVSQTGSNVNASNTVGSGAVYLYSYNDVGDPDINTWKQINYIKASYRDRNISFSSVAMSADGLLLAVGAYRDGSALTGIYLNNNRYNPSSAGNVNNSGAVFVFARTKDSWRRFAVIKPQVNNIAQRYFGRVVGFGGTAAAVESLVMGADGLMEVIAMQDLLPRLTVAVMGQTVTDETITLSLGNTKTVMVSGSDVMADVMVTIAVSGGVMVSTETITLSERMSSSAFTVTAEVAGDSKITLTAPQYRPAVIDFTVVEAQINVVATAVIAEGTSETVAVAVAPPPDATLTITVTADDPDNAIVLDNTELRLAADETNIMLTITADDNDQFNPTPRVATLTLTATGYTTATVVVEVARDTSARLVLSLDDALVLFTGVPTELIVNMQVSGDYGGLTSPVLSFAASPTEIIEVPPSQLGALNGETPVQVRGLIAGSATLTITVSGDNYVTTVAEVQVAVQDRPPLQIAGLDVSALSLVAGESTMRSLRVESMGASADGVEITVEAGDSNVVVAEATLNGVTMSGVGTGMSTVLVTASRFGYVTATATLAVNVEALVLTVMPTEVTLAEGADEASRETVTVQLNRSLNAKELMVAQCR